MGRCVFERAGVAIVLSTGFACSAAAIFGACVGSFLNVCIYRIPDDNSSLTQPRGSRCPKCEHAIRWFDNIPIVSWLVLRARCRDCGVRIPIRYPLVEALTAILFVLVIVEVVRPPLVLDWRADWVAQAAYWMVFLAFLVAITFIDIDLRIIPDSLSVNGTILALAIAPFVAGVPTDGRLPAWIHEWLLRLDGARIAADARLLTVAVLVAAGVVAAGIAMVGYRQFFPMPLFYDDEDEGNDDDRESGDAAAEAVLDRPGSRRRSWGETRLAGAVGAAIGVLAAGLIVVPNFVTYASSKALVAALLGMAAGSGAIYGVGVLGKVAFRKDAMGFGDVKLMALLGVALGWQQVLISIFIACVLGSVVGIAIKIKTGSSYIPFGPFLSAGALILILWGDLVAAGIEWYQSLFRVR